MFLGSISGSFPLAKSYLGGEEQGADWTGAAGALM